jgi:hypothetical protein
MGRLWAPNMRNKRKFQSRTQEEYGRNVSGTERKLVYKQKNNSYMEGRTKAEVSMKGQ